jgi:ATP-dependent helicase/nuclease subunit A
VTTELSDEGVRRVIAGELDATLFVEASAGSGKTTQLVARLLRILVSGRARVDEVAAITFTEAAAGELRDRLAGELERTVAENAESEAESSRAAEALAGLDGAAITTLHGFARRVLAEHPFAAGLPPVFEVLDEVRWAVGADERWRALVDRLLGDGEDARALQWAITCGIALEDLQAVAQEFDANWDLVPPVPPAPPLPPVVDRDPVLGPLRSAMALSGSCTEPGDKLLAHLRDLEPWARRLEGCADDVEVLGVLAGPGGRLSTTLGKAGSWSGRKAEVAGLLTAAQAAREQMVAASVDFALGQLARAIGRVTREAAESRRREGRLQFHDLLVLARDLVRDHPDVQAALHRQYRYLLVDEFQDTDPIQAELALRIASPEGPDPERRWQSLEVEPGRLFLVGDPKQSIYRFRRADPRLFHEVRTLLVSEPLQLTTNFRSVPGIVAWVDTAFEALTGSPHPPSRSARSARPGGPPVALLGSGPAAADRMEEVRAREAAEVASAVLSVRDEQWPVGEQSTPARLGDVTVLVPTRRSLPALQDAFDGAGIPYRLESSSLVYAAPEVQDLVTILNAVDDPTDEAAVVGALRSPGFGCGDDDLLRHRLAGGTWDYRAGRAGDGPVGEGLAALAELHRVRWWHGVRQLVGMVVERRRLMQTALDGPQWRESWRRLRFVLDQASQFAETNPGDLRGFLAWVDLQRDEDARVTEVVLPEGDVDAVRVMTIHAAKGLEFPVVIVAGLGSEPRLRARAALFGPDGPELAVRKLRETAGYRRLADGEKDADAAERLRLLYVATTRARDHLVVSVHRPRTGGQSMAARLDAVLESCATLWQPYRARAAAAPHAPTTREQPDADVAQRATWAVSRAERLASAAVPTVVAATGVSRLVEAAGPGEGQDDGIVDDDPERPAWRRGRAGTAVGRAVHAVLQSIDLVSGEGLAALAAAQAAAEGVPTRAGEVEALVRAALDSPIVRTAAESGRYWRELYVGTPFGTRVLEGFVDLLVEDPEGLSVVDYKTDQTTDLTGPSDGYRLQGAAYALAVEQVTGRPVERCTFLFLRADGALAREVSDLGAAKALVRQAVAQRG